jgi:histidinol dehydrogenase
MKIIEGFQPAKSVLSRQAPTEEVADIEQREQAVRQIISEVRRRGDAALFDYTLKFDGIRLEALELSKKQIKSAYLEVDKELLSAIKLAAERIRSYHQQQKDAIWSIASKKGFGQLIRPLERIGVYAPGGTASYPSTVLMTIIPAKVAGVKEVILVTQSQRGSSNPDINRRRYRPG